MKKIFKLVFSRLTLIILAIIMQVCLQIFIPIFLGSKFPSVPVNLIISILAIIIVIVIMNSDMKVEGQLPIIILCITFPVIGVAVCALFVSPNIPKKVKKYYFNTKNQMKKNMTISDDEKISLTNTLTDDIGHFNYIYNTTGLRSYKNTNVDFYSEGEKFYQALKENLMLAKKYIFMEYFIIEDGKMWSGIYEILKEKVKEGVEVRLMYDDVGTIMKLPSNFAKKLNKDGIKCVKFNEYSSASSSIYNNRDHRKITVIDGKIGFMGGINLADEYINEKKLYGHFKDTAVKLQGDAVKSLICMFLQLYDIQSKTMENYNEYFVNENDDKCDSENQLGNITIKNKDVYEENTVVCPFGDGPKYFYGEQVGENVFINLISQAKKYVYITTPYLIIDTELRGAILNASKRGVKVKIVTPHIPDKKLVFSVTRSNYKALLDGGVEILEYKEGFIHAKQILVDDKLAVVGTINLDYRSLIHHYECGVLMYNCRCLADIKRDFENIFKTAIDMQGYKQNPIAKLFCALIKLFTPLL